MSNVMLLVFMLLRFGIETLGFIYPGILCYCNVIVAGSVYMVLSRLKRDGGRRIGEVSYINPES